MWEVIDGRDIIIEEGVKGLGEDRTTGGVQECVESRAGG